LVASEIRWRRLGNASLLNATLLNEMVGEIEATSDGIAIPCA
jgi:hypothetical protein